MAKENYNIDLCKSAWDCDLDAVQNLLDSGADPDSRDPEGGATALQIAAKAGCLPVVRKLIESGADVNFTAPSDELDEHGRPFVMDTALTAALDNDHLEVAQLLLQAGAHLNANETIVASFVINAKKVNQNDREKVEEYIVRHGLSERILQLIARIQRRKAGRKKLVSFGSVSAGIIVGLATRSWTIGIVVTIVFFLGVGLVGRIRANRS